MTYLKQFARNTKGKGNTTVLTARLQERTYDAFKAYCDDLGLSISEAVSLLVENELKGTQGEYQTAVTLHEDEYKTNTTASKQKTVTSKQNTNRFTTKPFQIQEELPCPFCGSWEHNKSFSRHARKHNTTTKEIFTDDKYKDKIASMIAKRQTATEGINTEE